MIRKVRFALLLTLACFVVSLMVLLGSVERPLEAMPAQTVTPALGYLPLVLRQPTPTATATPTPTATPLPALDDGQYRAEVGYGYGGRIFFTVGGGGAEASGASFFFMVDSYCETAMYDFTGSVAISEGEFFFQEKDGDTVKASLSCEYVSDTEADCTAVRGGIPQGCDSVTGRATLYNPAAGQ